MAVTSRIQGGDTERERDVAPPRNRAAPADALAPPNLPLRAGLWAASRSLRTLGAARYLFADALGLAIYASSPRRARQTAANHKQLDPSISGSEARRRARGSFREFMRTSFDFVWEYAIPPQRMHRYFRVYQIEYAYDALREHGGGIFTLAHYGSWDVAAANALACNLPLTTVMTRVGTSDLATRIAAWARRHQDMDVLMTGGAARGLIRAVRRGRFDAILCDIPDRGERVLVDFCNGKVNFSTSPAWIARVTGVPIIPVDCWREGGLYRMRLHDPILVSSSDSDEAVMQNVAWVLEQQIKRMPTQWYPFGNVYKD
ncbi:MAG: lysophospholipid acyltransferase family protein [Candidatus Dormibacteraeota bacterium]|nr:lysophospholipid acyltransferase family protein [Candidatus Dormibacteraeota bacterium]MBV9525290.1 lysophospholipid acyltransferase family protein [Candidatus Dormibacteraeota bacterium]